MVSNFRVVCLSLSMLCLYDVTEDHRSINVRDPACLHVIIDRTRFIYEPSCIHDERECNMTTPLLLPHDASWPGQRAHQQHGALWKGEQSDEIGAQDLGMGCKVARRSKSRGQGKQGSQKGSMCAWTPKAAVQFSEPKRGCRIICLWHSLYRRVSVHLSSKWDL